MATHRAKLGNCLNGCGELPRRRREMIPLRCGSPGASEICALSSMDAPGNAGAILDRFRACAQMVSLSGHLDCGVGSPQTATPPDRLSVFACARSVRAADVAEGVVVKTVSAVGIRYDEPEASEITGRRVPKMPCPSVDHANIQNEMILPCNQPSLATTGPAGYGGHRPMRRDACPSDSLICCITHRERRRNV